MAETVVRFSVWVRVQHALVIVLFLVLAVTGVPQKWPTFDISRWLIDLMGGIFTARWLHRVAGYAFSGLLVAHLAVVIGAVLRRRGQPTMFFTRKDFSDAIRSLRYYLGRADTPPSFGRYNYGQKFEYWGLIFGSAVMVVSGLVLRFPVLTSRMLPAELIPVAKAFHSNEAMLALLIVLTWHMYSAHLSPEVFPMDSSIFTGRISRERQLTEHPDEN